MAVKNNKGTSLPKKLAIIFAISGVGLLVLSFFLSSQILLLMGLGLTFWGALFLLITPVRYVEGALLVSALSSPYLSSERILKQLVSKGKGYHMPAYPKDGYVPEHLKGLSDMVVYIPRDTENIQPPSLQELAEGKFMLKNPQGILLIPPGLGLLNSVEKRLFINFTRAEIADVCKIIPDGLSNYSLAKEITMVAKQDKVNVKIIGSIFKSFYTQQTTTLSVSLLGCPIVSSIACSLAKASGKPVAIQNINSSHDGKILEIQLQIFQG